MRYVIVTVEWAASRGILLTPEMRKSLDGTKVIFHEAFIAPVLNGRDAVKTYEHDDAELLAMLSGPEWTEQEEEEQG